MNKFKKKDTLIDLFFLSIIFIILFNTELTKVSVLKSIDIFKLYVLPALLPFIIATNIIIHFGSFTTFSSFLRPITCRFFSLEANCSFCILSGFLFGFPMGIKTINDLSIKNTITNDDALLLTILCHNISPIFYISILKNWYFITYNTPIPLHILICFFALPYMSAIICFFVLRSIISHSNVFSRIVNYNLSISISKKPHQSSKPISIIDNTLLTCGYIFIYIVIFNVIFSLISKKIQNPDVNSLIYGFFDISATLVNGKIYSNIFSICILMCQCTFGGISALFQGMQMLSNQSLSKYLLFISKIIQALISIPLTFILTLCLL